MRWNHIIGQKTNQCTSNFLHIYLPAPIYQVSSQVLFPRHILTNDHYRLLNPTLLADCNFDVPQFYPIAPDFNLSVPSPMEFYRPVGEKSSQIACFINSQNVSILVSPIDEVFGS